MMRLRTIQDFDGRTNLSETFLAKLEKKVMPLISGEA